MDPGASWRALTGSRCGLRRLPELSGIRPLRRRVPAQVFAMHPTHCPTANRSPHLDGVTVRDFVGEVARYFAVCHPLHRDFDPVAIGTCGEGVTAGGLIAVGRGQAYVDVLPSQVSGPTGHLESQRGGALGFWPPLHELGLPPGTADL